MRQQKCTESLFVQLCSKLRPAQLNQSWNSGTSSAQGHFMSHTHTVAAHSWRSRAESQPGFLTAVTVGFSLYFVLNNSEVQCCSLGLPMFTALLLWVDQPTSCIPDWGWMLWLLLTSPCLSPGFLVLQGPTKLKSLHKCNKKCTIH